MRKQLTLNRQEKKSQKHLIEIENQPHSLRKKNHLSFIQN